jgi:vacuolar-type H+-ATPase subunit D/Vma8
MAQVQHEIALTRAEIQTERQALVAENLPLTEEQATAFWPLYRTYREEMAKLGDRLVAAIEDYAKNYETMTDPQSSAMIKEFLKIQKDEIAVKTSWVPKFEKILPAKSVARFYQIENKLDLIVRVSVAAEIPLVSDPKE